MDGQDKKILKLKIEVDQSELDEALAKLKQVNEQLGEINKKTIPDNVASRIVNEVGERILNAVSHS